MPELFWRGTRRIGTDENKAMTWSYQSDAFGVGTPSGTASVRLRLPGQIDLGVLGISYNYFRDYEAATGRLPELVFGKPNTVVLSPLLKRFRQDEMVMVGDRLTTDKLLAENAGIDFILVLSGEAKREDLPGLVRQPTLVVDHLGSL